MKNSIWKKSAALVAALAMPLSATVFGVTAANAATDMAVQKAPPMNVKEYIFGEDRYETAELVSKHAFPNGAKTVFIVSGQNPSDGLAASAAAAKVNGSVLLALSYGLAGSTIEEIKRLNPSEIIVVGGPSSVSPNAFLQLSEARVTITPQRIAGENRQQTSALLAAKYFPDATEALVVNGWKFADALSAASAGAHKQIPVLLTAKDDLSTDVAHYLGRKKTAHLVGGEASLSAKLDQKVRSALGQDANVKRYDGYNRYLTNVKVVQAFFTEPATGEVKVALASGEVFPDAIVAAAAYSSKGAPVILGKYGDQLLDSFEEVNKRSDDWGTGVVHVGNSMDFHAGLPNRVLRPVP